MFALDIRHFALAALAFVFPTALPAAAQAPSAKLAVISSQSGGSFLHGIELAVEEANAEGVGPRIELDVLDDQARDDGAQQAAERVAASQALAVVGPFLSTSAIAAGPTLTKAGIAAIISTAESDLLGDIPIAYRTIFKNSDLGESLADYLRYALEGRRAAVIFVDNGYGRTLAEGFKRGAERLGLPTSFHGFSNAAQRDEAARRVAADPGRPAVVLGTLRADAVALVPALRRAGLDTPILGPTSMGNQSFVDAFKNLPEERRTRGHFTRSVYAAVPVILDSANARTLAFAQRFTAHFGAKHPLTWMSVQGYDATRLAIAAVRATAAGEQAGDVKLRRQAIRDWLSSLDSPPNGLPGLVGDIWFTPDRGRALPIRVGRFNDGLFESAPVQLVPASRPTESEIASGIDHDAGGGRRMRRQQVVYTGIHLNEIPRLDVGQSTLTADFYVWLRFSRTAGTEAADPTQLVFPDMVRGTFDSRQLAAQRDLDDGTTWRLWRVRGDFKNDFDLHHYPADSQTLAIRFFNARAASDRLVYVVDRATLDPTVANVGPGAVPGNGSSAINAASADPAAFRNLTQWRPTHVVQARENLVADSSLGDPGLAGAERMREWSGFGIEVEIHRLLAPTLAKTLLPIGLMSLILFVTLFFPPGLAAARVSVAITAGLAGAVLLAAINSQLGNVGYVMAAEYVFYVFFALCLLCITSVVVSEHRRLAGKSTLAVDWISRGLFTAGMLCTVIAAWVAVAHWR
jgi:branched-chain amino acid transport system substrate-binding protein